MSHTELIMKEGCRVTLTVPPGCRLAHTGASPESSEYTAERRCELMTSSEVNAFVTGEKTVRAIREGEIPHETQFEIVRAALVAAQDALRPTLVAATQIESNSSPAQVSETVARAGVRAWQIVNGL